jgi:hypothetical protein
MILIYLSILSLIVVLRVVTQLLLSNSLTLLTLQFHWKWHMIRCLHALGPPVPLALALDLVVRLATILELGLL